MRAISSSVLAAAFAAAVNAVPAPGAAQLVPRLVDYPVTRISDCAVDASSQLLERHRISYRNGIRRDDVLVYGGPGCSDDALLFVVSVEQSQTTITPAVAGVAFLRERCDAYAWHAGHEQNVTNAPCALAFPRQTP